MDSKLRPSALESPVTLVVPGLAPIALFAYRRPDHTLKTLRSLAACPESQRSELYVFCDGPKSDEDRKAVLQVREVVASQAWCAQVKIIEREENLGLATSIITGTSTLCAQYGRAIIIEDDLLLAPYFLTYVNEALRRYEGVPEVMQVSGHMFPAALQCEADALFLPFISSWGWGTWQRAWRHFDPSMAGFEVLKKNKSLREKFNLDGHCNFFRMLDLHRRGKINSWAVRWYLSVFMRGGLTLYPKRTLVKNFGFDGSGTHSQGKAIENNLALDIASFKFPDDVSESVEKHLVFPALSVASPKTRLERLFDLISI